MNRGMLAACALFHAASSAAHEIPKYAVELSGDVDISASRSATTASGESDVVAQSRTFDLTALYYIWSNVGVGMSAVVDRNETSAASGSAGTYIAIAGPALQWAVSAGDKTTMKLFGAIAAGSGESWAPGVATLEYDVRAAVIGAGLAYWVTDSASVDVGVSRYNYSYSRNQVPHDKNKSSDAVSLGVSIYLQ